MNKAGNYITNLIIDNFKDFFVKIVGDYFTKEI